MKFVKRNDRIDDRANKRSFEPGANLVGKPHGHCDFLFDRPRTEGRADNRDSLTHIRFRSSGPVVPASRPTRTRRPRVVSAARLPVRMGPPTRSITTLTPLPLVSDCTISAKLLREVSMPTSSPRAWSRTEFGRVRRVVPKAWQPMAWAIWTAAVPTPLAAACTSTVSPGEPALGEQGIMSGNKHLGYRGGLDEVEVGGSSPPCAHGSKRTRPDHRRPRCRRRDLQA